MQIPYLRKTEQKGIHEIAFAWSKMGVASIVLGLYRWIKLIFLRVKRESQKLKVDQKSFGKHGQKLVWPVWSQISIIDFI